VGRHAEPVKRLEQRARFHKYGAEPRRSSRQDPSCYNLSPPSAQQEALASHLALGYGHVTVPAPIPLAQPHPLFVGQALPMNRAPLSSAGPAAGVLQQRRSHS
jgi:hypothetical protein